MPMVLAVFPLDSTRIRSMQMNPAAQTVLAPFLSVAVIRGQGLPSRQVFVDTAGQILYDPLQS